MKQQEEQLTGAEPQQERPGRSLWGDALHRLRRDRFAVISFFVIATYLIIAVLSGTGLIATGYDEVNYKAGESQASTVLEGILRESEPGPGLRKSLKEAIATLKADGKKAFLRFLESLEVRVSKQAGCEDIAARLLELKEDMTTADAYSPPSWKHLTGTDIHGRDVLSRVIQGSWISLRVALVMSAIYIVIAVVLGAIAGFFGGWVDDIILWFYQTTASIPGILLLVALTFVLGKGLGNVAIALGLVGWVGLCRLMRAEFIKHRDRDYVLAARAQGAGNWRIMFRHILPNTFHIVIISFTLGFVGAIMGEVILTFLGLGAQAHVPSWGRMISEAQSELFRQPSVWWPLTGATIAMFIVCLAFNIFGDSLRDALDPKLKV